MIKNVVSVMFVVTLFFGNQTAGARPAFLDAVPGAVIGVCARVVSSAFDRNTDASRIFSLKMAVATAVMGVVALQSANDTDLIRFKISKALINLFSAGVTFAASTYLFPVRRLKKQQDIDSSPLSKRVISK